MSGPPTVAIVGLSSRLGLELAQRLGGEEVALAGTYRRWNDGLERLRRLYQDWRRPLDLQPLDVASAPGITNFVRRVTGALADPELPLVVVYVCGAWACGPVQELDASRFDEVVGVGLRAPSLLIAETLRQRPRNCRIVIVTGLGGEKNSIARNSLYGLCTNGIYSLVRSVGAELAGTGSSCIGLALGIFDKGQASIPALSRALSIGRPMSLAGPAAFLKDLVLSPDPSFNGGVIEMTGGLFNYRDVISAYLDPPAEATA